MPKNKKLDSYSYHEALHLCHVFCCMIEDHLTTHPAIINNRDWVKKCEAATFHLSQVYQEIGAIDYDKIDKNGKSKRSTKRI